MRKTHKKILGFAGLGLVAATTAVAAIIPSPIAAATTAASAVDTVKVTVLSPNPDLILSTDAGSSITTPEYNFSVAYSSLTHIEATLTNYDADGNEKFSTVLWDQELGGSAGSKDFSLNLDDYGGRGSFVINFVGTGLDGITVEQVLSVIYTMNSEEADIDPGSSETEVPVDVPTDKVETVVIEVYDDEGNLVKTITVDDPDDVETIDLSDLDDGVYTLVVTTKDEDGNTVETSTILTIVDTDGEDRPAVPVEIEDQPGTTEVRIEVVDENGDVVKTIVVPDPVSGTEAYVDVDGLPDGDYTIITTYYDENGDIVSTTSTNLNITDNNGQTDIDINKDIDSVTTIEVYIYDEDGNIVRTLEANRETGEVDVYDGNGNLLFTIPDGYKDGKITISMDGLPYGDYTSIILFRDANGKLVGDSIPMTVKYYGEPIIVPDTGSFFQGLNITREDYLITGLIVFMTIGVVAFGIVKRGHGSSKKCTRINGKRR